MNRRDPPLHCPAWVNLRQTGSGRHVRTSVRKIEVIRNRSAVSHCDVVRLGGEDRADAIEIVSRDALPGNPVISAVGSRQDSGVTPHHDEFVDAPTIEGSDAVEVRNRPARLGRPICSVYGTHDRPLVSYRCHDSGIPCGYPS